MSGITFQYRIQFSKLIRYPVLPKSHFLPYLNLKKYNVHVWHECRHNFIQYTPSSSLEFILPVKLFVVFGYPLRGQYRQAFPISCQENLTKAVFTLGPVPYRILANRTRRVDFAAGLHSHY